jgi:hypothetical protein
MTGKTQDEQVTIKAPKFDRAIFNLLGSAPYVQNRFSEKAINAMTETQKAGSQAKKGKKREPKDFDAAYEQAKHKSAEGWCGIPAGAFRAALISACRIVGFKMTLAKLSLFVEADGLDSVDGTPLVRIQGTPIKVEHAVRLATGVMDIRPRPMWKEWSCQLRIKWDADQFSLTDVSNLLMRVGMQVGIGEGRPDSRNSAGMGWGTFELANEIKGRKSA